MALVNVWDTARNLHRQSPCKSALCLSGRLVCRSADRNVAIKPHKSRLCVSGNVSGSFPGSTILFSVKCSVWQ